jgi:N-glycosylase/DNA lyase
MAWELANGPMAPSIKVNGVTVSKMARASYLTLTVAYTLAISKMITRMEAARKPFRMAVAIPVSLRVAYSTARVSISKLRWALSMMARGCATK